MLSEDMNKKIYIKTFGCQMNEHDSVKIGLLLENLGYSKTEDPFLASIVLFNTCTIREKAYHKAISEIGRARFYKDKNPDTIVIVCGCVAEQEGKALIERYPHVDFVVGPDEIYRLPEFVKLKTKKSEVEDNVATRLINTLDEYHFINLTPNSKGSAGATAFVTIMKGCNNACSFCIVPQVRGREVSRQPQEIVDEVNSLTEIGVKEVVLLGQNVNSYGKGIVPSLDFAGLVRKIAAETDISRIRFTSPHPKDLSINLMEEYAANEKLCPHMHLPVQSGSNRILKIMNRCYTREEFMEKVDRLKNLKPCVSVTTDMIIGFPTETDDDFEDTLDLMRRVQFDGMYAFKYSPRPETYAAKKYEDDIKDAVKDDRLKRVLALNEEITLEKYETYVGTVQEVLVEGLSRRGKGQMTGRIPTNNIVNFTGDFCSIGDILPVRINKANKNSLDGELVS